MCAVVDVSRLLVGQFLGRKMRKILGRLRTGSGRAVRSLEFGLARELEWPAWALATRLGKSLPRAGNDNSRVLHADYSLKSFAPYRPLARTEWLYHALASIPGSPRDRVLIVGPRFANERFLARALGFPRSQIVMVDTFSYSKHVQAGDMHEMRHPNESFSSVICGWTLAYSGEPAIAASEMSRVLKPGGHLVLGMQLANAEPALVQGWSDLISLFPLLIPMARFESAENLIAVFGKGTSGLYSN